MIIGKLKKRIFQAKRTVGCFNGVGGVKTCWSSKKRKYSVYDAAVKSGLLCGTEASCIKMKENNKVRDIGDDVLRRVDNTSRQQRISNEEIEEGWMEIKKTLFHDGNS